MFDGEFASLKAIEETDTIKVPKPIAVLQNGASTTILVMEHLELKNVLIKPRLEHSLQGH